LAFKRKRKTKKNGTVPLIADYRLSMEGEGKQCIRLRTQQPGGHWKTTRLAAKMKRTKILINRTKPDCRWCEAGQLNWSVLVRKLKQI
jgi:hypothetical protein